MTSLDTSTARSRGSWDARLAAPSRRYTRLANGCGACCLAKRAKVILWISSVTPPPCVYSAADSLLDLTKLPKGDGEQVLANVVVEGEPPVAVMPAAASRHVLYTDLATRTLRRGRSHGSARNQSRRCRWQYPYRREPSTGS